MILFVPKRDGESIEWRPELFDGKPVAVCLNEQEHAVVVDANRGKEAAFWVIPWQEQGGRLKGLLVCADHRAVLVNGQKVLSATVLRHQDEIALGSEPSARVFFSTEERLDIVPFKVPFEEKGEPVYCARSKQRLVEGTPAVRCTCGLWYIQTDDMPAFTYDAVCVGCRRPTTLGDYSWRPASTAGRRRTGLDRFRTLWAKCKQDVEASESTVGSGS